jgi:chemotaxis protein CheX
MEGDDVKHVHLAPVLDLRAAKPLAEALLAARGKQVVIQAQDVRRLGGLCLQVLLSADLTWARDGRGMQIKAPSEAFCAATHLFGATSLARRFTERSYQ